LSLKDLKKGDVVKLRIVNLKNGLEKIVDASAYSIVDLAKTFLVYEGNDNFMIKVLR
jgi:hypothetical protein